MEQYILKDVDNAILRFNEKYLFLSNFYEGDTFEYKGCEFRNSEAAFHSQKCPIRIAEFEILRPAPSKRLGRTVTLREDWEDVKEQVMYEVCYAKFTQDETLKQKLIDTGDKELVEGNYHKDNYWGMLYNYKTSSWQGYNRLGVILMQIREELKNSK